MKTLLRELRAALLGALALVLVCCGLYPLAVYGVAQSVFRIQANGSLVLDARGRVRGSVLIGQRFAGPQYFRSRPSAVGYDAAASGGSNLGPTSRTLHDQIGTRVASWRRENALDDTAPVPADAATASGSGLDPHIRVESALLQVPRVAAARGLDPSAVRVRVERTVESPQLGFLGEPRVNVLRLNQVLDRADATR